jgi:proprotein convertase subtilisin/kexin type 5
MNYGNLVSCITIDSGCEAGATADNLGCSKCKLGSYLVGNRCKVAPSGCALTNVSSACLHCHDGYYLGGGNTCALCDRVYPGCMKCDTDATTCRVCNKGFRLQGSKCELCPLDCNYCQTTDKFTCDECRPGYWPKRETISSQVWITCQPCPGTCSTCSEENYCTSCITGTYINADNFCAVCPANCGICVDYQACVKCADGYYLTTSGVCELCSSECKECTSPSSCHLCNTGFVLNGGGCDKCPYMCKNCTDREGCTECHDGFYVDPLTAMCLACTPNCLTCRSANNCITCDSHYYKNSLNGCSVCDTSCQTCTNSGKCRTCINNYFLNEGRTCQQCENGCLGCGSALDCHTSWETYYLDSENTPVICPAGCNLAKCSDNYGCTECGTGFYLTPPKTCQQADVNCKIGYVSDRIGCEECKSGFFISNMHAPQDGVNYICSDCTQGCGTCNTKDIANPANTGCTARKSGYYLANKLTYPCDETSSACDTATNHLGCIDGYF